MARVRKSLPAACAMLIAFSATASASDTHVYKLVAHDDEVFGKYALLDGNVDVAIGRFERRLDGATANSRRAPLLINLCAAYTLKRDFAKAEERCNAAIENGWSVRKAHNNRGIMRVARGDYLAAVEDFEVAAGRLESGIYGRHLLQARNRIDQADGDSRFASAFDDDTNVVAVAR